MSSNYLITQNYPNMAIHEKVFTSLDTAKQELFEEANILFKHFKHSLSYKYRSTPYGT